MHADAVCGCIRPHDCLQLTAQTTSGPPVGFRFARCSGSRSGGPRSVFPDAHSSGARSGLVPTLRNVGAGTHARCRRSGLRYLGLAAVYYHERDEVQGHRRAASQVLVATARSKAAAVAAWRRKLTDAAALSAYQFSARPPSEPGARSLSRRRCCASVGRLAGLSLAPPNRSGRCRPRRSRSEDARQHRRCVPVAGRRRVADRGRRVRSNRASDVFSPSP